MGQWTTGTWILKPVHFLLPGASDVWRALSLCGNIGHLLGGGFLRDFPFNVVCLDMAKINLVGGIPSPLIMVNNGGYGLTTFLFSEIPTNNPLRITVAPGTSAVGPYDWSVWNNAVRCLREMPCKRHKMECCPGHKGSQINLSTSLDSSSDSTFEALWHWPKVASGISCVSSFPAVSCHFSIGENNEKVLLVSRLWANRGPRQFR